MLAIALLVETSLPQLAASATKGSKCTPGLLQKAGFSLVTARTTLLGGFLLLGGPLNHPTPTQKLPCQLCGGVEWCVANHKVGLPDKFLTVDEAFKRIAGMVVEPPKHSS
jgi:hypothetical protein